MILQGFNRITNWRPHLHEPVTEGAPHEGLSDELEHEAVTLRTNITSPIVSDLDSVLNVILMDIAGNNWPRDSGGPAFWSQQSAFPRLFTQTRLSMKVRPASNGVSSLAHWGRNNSRRRKTMKYAKPEIAVLGEAVNVIEMVIGTKLTTGTDNFPQQGHAPNPAYDLDE